MSILDTNLSLQCLANLPIESLLENLISKSTDKTNVLANVCFETLKIIYTKQSFEKMKEVYCLQDKDILRDCPVDATIKTNTLIYNMVELTCNTVSKILKTPQNSLQNLNFNSIMKPVLKNAELNIGDILVKFSEKGLRTFVKQIIESERFSEIPVDGAHGLGRVLYEASGNGLSETVQKIIKSVKFSEIHINVRYGLGDALRIASKNGNSEIVEMIMASVRFSEIPAASAYGLGSALWIASRSGYPEIVQMIMASEKFSEIPADGAHGLGGALLSASSGGHSEIVKMIMASEKFSEIPVDGLYGLRGSLAKASSSGPAADAYGLRGVLWSASSCGHSEIIEMFMASDRFNEIFLDGMDGLI